MKSLPINDSSNVEEVTRKIKALLKEGQVREAASLAISFLSSNDKETVGATRIFQLRE